MDRNSLRTSVVIEVANQEEPDDQKTYHIDFDDLDVPKDYVIDQVFCGENVVVYAVFEVPEDSNTSGNDQMVDVTVQKAQDNCRFFQRNSSKKIMSHRKVNEFKQNLINQEESVMDVPPKKDNENRSFYCLKHLNGDYDMLSPEQENSELKVLYSKNCSPKNSKSTKFKAVSKGVNTDIVQSPKIISEVQKVVRQNLPVSNPAKVKSIPSGIPSYEVIEMEMRQSFSSLSSSGDSKKPAKKSVPNFFLVPLLMMDDGVLSHFQNDDKGQKLLEEKEKKAVVPEKVSMGTNTDTSMSTLPLNGNKQKENGFYVSASESLDLGSDVRHEILTNRYTILSEIKILQGKLDTLIKSMESNAFDLDFPTTVEVPPREKLDSLEEPPQEKLYSVEEPPQEKLYLVEEPPQEKLESLEESPLEKLDSLEEPSQEKLYSVEEPPLEKLYSVEEPPQEKLDSIEEPTLEKLDSFEATLSGFRPFKITSRMYDDLPIFSHLQYPPCRTGKKKSAGTPPKEQKDIVVVPTISTSVEFISDGSSSKSQITKTSSIPQCHYIKSTEELKGLSSNCSIVWSDLENRRGAGLSKSTTNGLSSLDSKFSFINGLKKSFSFDLRDVKLEVMCLKKIKNNSFKMETKANIRIPQKREAIMKCEMGDEACNKQKTSKIDLLSLAKPTEKAEDLKFEQKNLDTKKILKEEGDVKTVYSTQNLLARMMARKTESVEVRFCNSISITAQDNLLPVVENTQPTPVKPKVSGSVVEDREPKPVSDADKPSTPSKTYKRPMLPNVNPKKEVKTVRKFNYQSNKVKQVDKTTKTEVKEVSSQEAKQRTVAGNRKSTVKGTAESKLHVDKLVKSENSTGSKTSVEKPGVKTSRLVSQKRDSSDPAEEKTSKTSSNLNRKENSVTPGLGKIGRGSTEEHTREVVPEQPGVVAELLPDKASEKYCHNEDKKCTDLIESIDSDAAFELKTKSQEGVRNESQNPDKPVAKSVWALTKVLLFEDGSKKIEILEASLTPPGYSLPKTPTE